MRRKNTAHFWVHWWVITIVYGIAAGYSVAGLVGNYSFIKSVNGLSNSHDVGCSKNISDRNFGDRQAAESERTHSMDQIGFLIYWRSHGAIYFLSHCIIDNQFCAAQCTGVGRC